MRAERMIKEYPNLKRELSVLEFQLSRCEGIDYDTVISSLTFSKPEAKLYLRLDGTEEDALIQALLETAESLCQDIVRTDFDEMEEVPEIVKVGICYAVTYLYENREKADFDELTRMLKFLLYSVRKEEF